MTKTNSEMQKPTWGDAASRQNEPSLRGRLGMLRPGEEATAEARRSSKERLAEQVRALKK